MQKTSTNILIIGSGLSGAIAALTAAEENKDVILVTNCPDLLSGNTPWAQGGIAYPDPKNLNNTLNNYPNSLNNCLNNYPNNLKLVLNNCPNSLNNFLESWNKFIPSP